MYDIDENGERVQIGTITSFSQRDAEKIAYAMDLIVDTEHKSISHHIENGVAEMLEEINVSVK